MLVGIPKEGSALLWELLLQGGRAKVEVEVEEAARECVAECLSCVDGERRMAHRLPFEAGICHGRGRGSQLKSPEEATLHTPTLPPAACL